MAKVRCKCGKGGGINCTFKDRMAENSAHDNTLNDNTAPQPEDDGRQDAPSKICSFVAWVLVCGC